MSEGHPYLEKNFIFLITFLFFLSLFLPLFFTADADTIDQTTTKVRIEDAFGTGEGTLPDDLMEDDEVYYELTGGQSADHFTVSSFNTSGKGGGISKVELYGQYKILSATYRTPKPVEYRPDPNADWREATNITPREGERQDTTKSEDITDLYQEWTWDRISELQVRHVNPRGRIAWDTVWLKVTISETEYELKVQKQVDRKECAPGEKINYKIWYNNTGSAVLDEVYVNDTFDSNLKYISDSTQQTPKVEGNTYSWHFNSVSVGSNSFTVTLKVNESTPNGTEISNQAVAEYRGKDWSTTTSNVVITIVEYVPASVSLTASKEDVIIGTEFNYTIDISVETERDFTCRVNDSLSTYLEYVSDDSEVEPKIENGTVSWKLNITRDTSFDLRVKVKSSTPDGIEIENDVTIRYTLEKTYSKASNTVYVTAHSSSGYINIQVPSTSISPGEKTNVTVTCHNVGETEFSPAWVNLSIDEMTYVSDSLEVEPEVEGSTLSYALNEIPPGGLEFDLTLRCPLSSDNGELNNVQALFTYGLYDELHTSESNELVLTTKAPRIYVTLDMPSKLYLDSVYNATVTVENLGMADSRWVNLSIASEKLTFNGSHKSEHTLKEFGIETRELDLRVEPKSVGAAKVTLDWNYTTPEGSPYENYSSVTDLLVERRSQAIEFNATFSKSSYVVGEEAAATISLNSSSPLSGKINVTWESNITLISSSEDPDVSEEKTASWNKSFVGRTELLLGFGIGKVNDDTRARFNFSFEFGNEELVLYRDIRLKAPEISLITIIQNRTLSYNDESPVDIFVYNNGSVPLDVTLRFQLGPLTYTYLPRGVYEPSTRELRWQLTLEPNSTSRVRFNVTPVEEGSSSAEVRAETEGEKNGLRFRASSNPVELEIKGVEEKTNYRFYLIIPLIAFIVASFISVWRR
ncbi:MAG: DUF11 domain-containing protein [Candidatus Thermoplasmatota archaeon]|nr:DUF11 domain-containing protein [Candidatus Thermoplasmatota archaeon]